MTLVSLAIAAPVGIFAAIFLVEYAKKRQPFCKDPYYRRDTFRYSIHRIWSVRYAVLCNCIALGHILLSGALTMVIMVLPLIMRTAEEGTEMFRMRTVRASFGLGAGNETAALIYTAGSVAKVPSSLMGSGRTLALHMYVLSSEGLYMDQAYATAVILLIFVLVLNWVSGFCAKHLSKAANGQ